MYNYRRSRPRAGYHPPRIAEARKKVVRVEFVNTHMPEEKRKLMFESLRDSHLFKKTYVVPFLVNTENTNPKNAEDYFPSEAAESFDFLFRVYSDGGGFFEPYCILTLAILPCTPPLIELLSVKVLKGDKVLGVYSIIENATEISWAFGFLLPAADRQEIKYQMVLANLWSHLILQMEKDDVFKK